MQNSKSKLKKFIYVLLITSLAACGGSGSNNTDLTTSQSPVALEPKIISGGSPGSPASINLLFEHEISTSYLNNYFKYEGKEGERVFIQAVLDTPLTDVYLSRCSAYNSGGSGPRGPDIKVYNEQVDIELRGTCGTSIGYTFPDDATYVFYFNIGGGSSAGYFNVTSIEYGYFNTSPVDTKSLLGSAGNPVKLGQSNEISSNVFYNYYHVTARKGDKIFLGANLQSPVDSTLSSRCESYGRRTSGLMRILDANFNSLVGTCFKSIEYIFPKDDTYIIVAAYPSNNSGTLSADVIYKDQALFSNIEIAEKNTIYISSPLAIQNDNLTVSIDSGSLYKNGNKVTGFTTQARTADIIHIENLSGVNLGDVIISNANVGNESGAFEIVTKQNDYEFIANSTYGEDGLTLYYLHLVQDSNVDIALNNFASKVTIFSKDMEELYTTGVSSSFSTDEGYYIVEIDNLDANSEVSFTIN